MNDATRVPAAVKAGGEILDSLKVRRLEVVDDRGRTRIWLGAITDGPAEVRVAHPENQTDISVNAGPIEAVSVSLQAGLDLESGGYGRAGLHVEDGDEYVCRVDRVTDTLERARLKALEERVQRLEISLSFATIALREVAVAGAADYEARCPFCGESTPASSFHGHVGSEACDRQRAGLGR
jgi:hypothetical protein